MPDRHPIPSPEAPAVPPPPLYRADVAACRASLAANSRTFHAASRLLPPEVRTGATVLYGFCRLADDAVDVHGGRLEAVARLRERIARVYAGRPLPAPADRALAAVVARHAIPRALPELLLDGLEWDAQGRVHETLDDVLDYAARVAGTVGAMMSLLMDARDPRRLARATDLGVAMQLTNIARDVAEDARMGRLYLPRAWLREAGHDPDAWLAAPRLDAAVQGVRDRLLAVADALYARVGAGVAGLPLACRPGINAARLLYAAIGHEARRGGLDALAGRATVPARTKALLLARAALALRPRAGGIEAPPLRANEPLLAAVAAHPGRPARPSRAEFVLDLFERLGRADGIGERAA